MAIRAAETTGWPLGTPGFVADLERRLGRPLARPVPGHKPATASPAMASRDLIDR